MTYAGAGVDTEKQKAAVRALMGSITFARKGLGAPIGGRSHFAGLVDFGDRALAICTDGVGSKLQVAAALKKWDTVGIDCVAMNVNDCICVGAEPLAFVDYIATREPDPRVAAEIGEGLNAGARQANVTLAGGETAILPDLVNGWDLAGTCVGFVSKANIIDGSRIRRGDAIIGLASTGLHSNGYTLARKIVTAKGLSYEDGLPGGAHEGRTLGQVLIEPTRIYVRSVLDLRDDLEVHGLANITGGGLKNIPRLNPRFRYSITNPMPVPKVFQLLQEWGEVEDREMYQTFNMGMGFVVIVPASEEKEAVRSLKAEHAQVVGRVEKGSGAALESLGLKFESKT